MNKQSIFTVLFMSGLLFGSLPMVAAEDSDEAADSAVNVEAAPVQQQAVNDAQAPQDQAADAAPVQQNAPEKSLFDNVKNAVCDVMLAKVVSPEAVSMKNIVQEAEAEGQKAKKEMDTWRVKGKSLWATWVPRIKLGSIGLGLVGLFNAFNNYDSKKTDAENIPAIRYGVAGIAFGIFGLILDHCYPDEKPLTAAQKEAIQKEKDKKDAVEIAAREEAREIKLEADLEKGKAEYEAKAAQLKALQDKKSPKTADKKSVPTRNQRRGARRGR